MAGSTTIVDYGSGGSLYDDGVPMARGGGGQRCVVGDEPLAEFRSSGQVESGTASTSPPFWDTDEDEVDPGLKPSALYGKFTWKIEKFSQITKRELRSNAFEVGGYKWYILIYPQGCDVCNHLSLFLCVADHDKLLPGWSHFAQFTIAVVNKDPKKSKYSDTLHRFWKKEHDWGWKKFMELAKVLDGFVNDDSLVIKAQVQVIREKANRPFRCLDCQYRRELVRVYLSNVDQICRRFIEDRKGKFIKLIEDKARWSSFGAFWLGINQITRRHMSRDKTDTILKGVVKHFFVEKEVTSTLVMDSLYSGLKSLESQGKNKKGGTKLVEMVEFPASIIHIEKDMFVLADDVLLLLERVALGPMPLQPSTPKDEKGSQNRTKDASSGDEFNKDTIERDERRLTDFGRGVLEFFVVAHIFGKIEVAYQEAVALKRQEELIREEEAAEQAENELKAKRSVAEKEKRTRKKQAKQRRNNRKVKDGARDEIKSDFMVQKDQQHESQPNEVLLGPFTKQEVLVVDKYRASENAADTSDTGDDISEMAIQPDLEDRDCSSINWDTDTSEIHPAEVGNEQILNGQTEKRTASSVMDDSSSTCSTDSIPSVVMNNVPFKGNSSTNRIHVPHYRGKSQQGKDLQTRPSDVGHLSGAGIIRTLRSEPEIVLATNARNQGLEHPVEEKKKLNVKDQVNSPKPSNLRTLDAAAASSSTITSSSSSSSSSPGRSDRILHSSSSHQANQPQEGFTSTVTTKSESSSGVTQTDPVKESPACSSNPSSSLVHSATRSPQISTFKIESEKLLTPAKSSSSSLARQEATSRPSSAPLISAPPRRPTPPLASTTTIQSTSPLLSRSLSAAGKLDAPSFVPHSYRSAIIGKNDDTTFARSSLSGFTSQSMPPLSSTQPFVPQMLTVRKDEHSSKRGLAFGSMKPPEPLQSHYYPPRGNPSLAGPSSSHNNSNHVADEFPHLDIINDLLDEDKNIGVGASNFPNPDHHQHHLFNNQQFSYNPGDVSRPRFFDRNEQFNDHQRVYGSSHVDLVSYNGQFDGHMVQSQWVDLSTMMMMSGNIDGGGPGGYLYQIPDYSRTGDMNRYAYPPAPAGNGH